MSTLYAKLIEAGCKVENHESDLYVQATPDAMRIVRAHGMHFDTFVSAPPEGDGRTIWIEVPFAYEPFWTKTIREAGREQITG